MQRRDVIKLMIASAIAPVFVAKGLMKVKPIVFKREWWDIISVEKSEPFVIRELTISNSIEYPLLRAEVEFINYNTGRAISVDMFPGKDLINDLMNSLNNQSPVIINGTFINGYPINS